MVESKTPANPLFLRDEELRQGIELMFYAYRDFTFESDQQLKRYDGNGYVYLTETFLPRLREAGVSDAEIETMTVANPRRLLTVG